MLYLRLNDESVKRCDGFTKTAFVAFFKVCCADELEAVKQRTRANFIRGLQGNSGMASQLAWYQTFHGDWRELFNEVERIEAVTLDDVKRVAGEVFVPSNRTVGIIETEETDS